MSSDFEFAKKCKMTQKMKKINEIRTQRYDQRTKMKESASFNS
jgi:hypothetical protein